MYSAKRRNTPILIGASIVFALLTAWAIRHIESIVALSHHGQGGPFAIIYGLSFFLLFWQVILYTLERPYKTTPVQQRTLDKRQVIVNVPVCNEDPAALRLCIISLLEQSRPVDLIHVVVNGPNKIDYAAVQAEVAALAAQRKIPLFWMTQAIAGKRQAQARTAELYLQPRDFFMTVDSDAWIDSEGVLEGLKPFADKRVMSVAGIVLTINMHNWFARFSDLWFLVGQLVDRSAYSTMGSVLVNSGVLAFYRGHIILDNLDTYITEEFFGRPVEFSDDSLLTIFALQRGRTVQQPTAFSFTLMPEKISHHFRQQMRWMRGAFIRSWWRFKYLPLNGYAYWGHFIGWAQMLLSSFIFVYLFLFLPSVDHKILPWLLVVPLLVGYGQALRYLTIWRSDRSWLQQFGMFLLEPIPALWSYFVLRFVRWYAIATCLKTGWGTRQDVEVSLGKGKV